VSQEDYRALRVLGWTMAVCSPAAAVTIAGLRTMYMDDVAFYLTIIWMVGCMFAGIALITIRR